MSKDEQPTRQTVRDILNDHWSNATGTFSTVEAAYYYHQDMTDEAEAAINAHIVSVLEELLVTSRTPNGEPYDHVKWSDVRAAIAKYKQGEK